MPPFTTYAIVLTLAAACYLYLSLLLIFHILLSDIIFSIKNNDNVGKIGIDVSTTVHVIIRIQFKA